MNVYRACDIVSGNWKKRLDNIFETVEMRQKYNINIEI